MKGAGWRRIGAERVGFLALAGSLRDEGKGGRWWRIRCGGSRRKVVGGLRRGGGFQFEG